MPQVTVTVEQVLTMKGNDVPMLQNLGPDPLFFGREADPASTGFRLGVGETYEFTSALVGSGWGRLVVASSGTSDLRYGSVG